MTERAATAREAISAAVKRCSAQTLASEVARDLAQAVVMREAAEHRLVAATRFRESLEQQGRPGVLRPRARARHDAALGTARQNERDAQQTLDERLKLERVERARLKGGAP